MFGGPGWTLDPERGRFYYHAYLREQPDLDWRNPELREAMLGVLRFWLDRGVDGFRVDALRQVLKDPELRDNPPNPDYRPGQPEYDQLLPVHSADHEDLAPVIAMAETIAERGGVMVGELYVPLERLARYHGAGVHMPSNMHLISTPWEPRALAALIEEYERVLPEGAWPNWVLGNHDRSRVASRVGPEQARVAAMLLLTLRGTPTLYYGDELGLPDVAIPPERVQDPWEEAGRDPARTPMQWSAARRLHDRRAVAAVRRPRAQRRGAAGGPGLDAQPAPRADRAAARVRGRALRDAGGRRRGAGVPPRGVRGRAEPLRRGGGAARRPRRAQHPRRAGATVLRPNEGVVVSR